jgi:hypothetical protein
MATVIVDGIEFEVDPDGYLYLEARDKTLSLPTRYIEWHALAPELQQQARDFRDTVAQLVQGFLEGNKSAIEAAKTRCNEFGEYVRPEEHGTHVG